MARKAAKKAEKPGAYHHPDLRQAILDEALALLREDGLKALTIRTLAARAGVSHAAPYRHFASKEEIVATLMLQGHVILARDLQAAHDNTPGTAADRLAALGKAYVDFSRSHPTHLKLMFSREGISAVVALGDKAKTTMEDPGLGDSGSFGPLARTVAECQEEGSLDPRADTESLAMAVWAQVHGIAILFEEGLIGAMAEERGRDGEAALEEMLELVKARKG